MTSQERNETLVAAAHALLRCIEAGPVIKGHGQHCPATQGVSIDNHCTCRVGAAVQWLRDAISENATQTEGAAQ